MYNATLSSQRAVFQAAFSVNPTVMERLDVYVELLHSWQRAKNLISATTLSDIWSRHITDSFQLIRIRTNAQHIDPTSDQTRWLDLGSGAGLPGMVVALALSDGQTKSVSLIEANGRKCSFLRAVSRETQCPVHVYSKRIESLDTQADFVAPDIITARALAPLSKLCDLMASLMSPKTIALVHKGQDFGSEIENTAKYWDFFVVEHKSQVVESSVILEISGLKKRALP